jgi:hypothetical protein
MWKRHAIYESRPRSVIVTLGGHLYRIPEVVLTTVPPKQCRKVISHTAKFSLFTICSKGEQKDTATTAALAQDLSFQQKQIAEEKEDIVSSPTMVPTHFPVKPRYNRLVEQIQPRQQQVRDSLQQAKQVQLLQQGKQLTKIQIQQTLSPLPRELNAMETIAS